MIVEENRDSDCGPPAGHLEHVSTGYSGLLGAPLASRDSRLVPGNRGLRKQVLAKIP